MNIVWVTSESVPYAKTGGLADVSASLPAALAERGAECTRILLARAERLDRLLAED